MRWGFVSQIDDALEFGVGGTTPELSAGVLPGFGRSQHHGFAAIRAPRNGIVRFLLSLREACGGELLTVTAFGDELSFERGYLLVEQVVGLVD
jgi:hypothetical protein